MLTNPEECKYYFRCSCNNCPLDSRNNIREILSLDKQKMCIIEKKERREKEKKVKNK